MNTVPKEFRASRKLLQAVADLHTRGYQRLRILAYQYDLGTWRCSILPAIWVSRDHGARLAEGVDHGRLANYTSASENTYWDWVDNHHSAPSRLAEVFLERFPELAQLGYGQDWLYAGWFQHMLHVTYPDALPATVLQSSEPFIDYVGSLGREVRIPLPPPGHSPAGSAW